MRAVSGLVLVLLAGVLGVQAIHEDQVGTFDWYKQYVGEVLAGELLLGRDMLYVATQQNLVAALSTVDGSIQWRRTFTDADALERMLLLEKPALVLTVSKGGKYMRAWDLAEGAFKWEAVLAGPVHGSFDVAVAKLGGASSQSILLVANGTVQVHEASRGDVVWSSSLPEATSASKQAIFSNGEHVWVAAYSPGQSEMTMLEFEAADGALLSDKKTWTAPEALGGIMAFSKEHVAVLSEDAASICTAGLGSEDGRMQCVRLADMDAQLKGSKGIALEATSTGVAVLTAEHGVALLSSVGGLRLLSHFPGATAMSAAAAGADGTQYIGIVGASAKRGAKLEVADAATGSVIHTMSPPPSELPYPSLGTPATVRRAILSVSKGRAGATKPSVSAAVVWSDHALQLLSRGAVAWHREEALGSVQKSMFVELPAASGGVQAMTSDDQDGIFGDRFKRWIRLQVLTVLLQLKLNTPEHAVEFKQLRQALNDNNKATRDPNGFRKLILVHTAANKVLALHNGDGRVMWARQYAVDATQGATWLLPWRSFHDLTHAPQVAMLSSGAGALSIVNAHSGEEVDTLPLPDSVSKVVPVPLSLHDGQAEQSTYLLVSAWEPTADAPPSVHLIPDTAPARQLLARHAPSLFFYLLDEGSGAVAGFGLDGSSVDNKVLGAVAAWRLQLPGQVLATAARHPAEPIQSLVKVLGDRSLMYKYVNPNTLFVATYTPGDLEAGTSVADPEEGRVTVHVIDTVTGALLVRQSHLGARGPVQAVLSEHWLVYTLWDVVTIRPQAHVMELYDASPRDLSLEAIIRGRTSNTTHADFVSSYAPPAINVLAQAFYLQIPLKGLSVTHTGQGITTKQLLMSTITDQVYAMDKRFLDPRRPLRAKPTPQEQEEQLMPYQDTLPFGPTLYITQNRVVAQLKAVTTAPSDLESTCLVFVHGADLFYTRSTPAKHFDSLEPDFSYGLLVLGLLMLAVGTVAARMYTNNATLKAKWQ